MEVGIGPDIAGLDPAYVMNKLGVDDPTVVPYLVMKMKTGSSIQLGISMFRIPEMKDGSRFETVRFPPHVLKQEIYHIDVEETPHDEAPADPDKLEKTGAVKEQRRRFSIAADGPAQPLPVFSESIMRQIAQQAGIKSGDYFGLDW